MTDPLSPQCLPQKSVPSAFETLSFINDKSLPSWNSLEHVLSSSKRLVSREHDMSAELLLGHGAFREELVLAEQRRVRMARIVLHFLLTCSMILFEARDP